MKTFVKHNVFLSISNAMINCNILWNCVCTSECVIKSSKTPPHISSIFAYNPEEIIILCKILLRVFLVGLIMSFNLPATTFLM